MLTRKETISLLCGVDEAGRGPLAGSVYVSYDAILAEPSIVAVSQVILPIHHCVLGVPGATSETPRVVESHPVALAQCLRFCTRNPSIVARAVYDTAGAALEVAHAQDVTRGALASRLAASHYGLTIVEADVEDRADNQTRFLLLGRTRAALADGALARTLLVVTTENKALAAMPKRPSLPSILPPAMPRWCRIGLPAASCQ
jgi:prephenate dehydratase